MQRQNRLLYIGRARTNRDSKHEIMQVQGYCKWQVAYLRIHQRFCWCLQMLAGQYIHILQSPRCVLCHSHSSCVICVNQNYMCRATCCQRQRSPAIQSTSSQSIHIHLYQVSRRWALQFDDICYVLCFFVSLCFRACFGEADATQRIWKQGPKEEANSPSHRCCRPWRIYVHQKYLKYMYWRILFEMCWPPVVHVVKCCCETCLHAMCLLSHLQKERVLRRSSQIPFRNSWNGNWGFLAILICHHSVCVCVPVHININVNITRRPLCLRHGTLQNQAANYLIWFALLSS